MACDCECPTSGTPHEKTTFVLEALGVPQPDEEGYGKNHFADRSREVLLMAFQANPDCGSYPELRQTLEGPCLETRLRDGAADLFEKLRQAGEAQEG